MTREEILSTLEALETSNLVALWNEYCDINNLPDDIVYSMDDFDELMGEAVKAEGALWLAQRCYFGDFNPNKDWFYFNAYGNLESFDYYFDSKIDLDSLADAIENEEISID